MTVIIAVPETAGSCDVAFTVTVFGLGETDEGAVYLADALPVGAIVPGPEVMDQVVEVLNVPFPVTTALQLLVLPGAVVPIPEGAQVTVTPVTLFPDPFPHASVQEVNAFGVDVVEHVFVALLVHVK